MSEWKDEKASKPTKDGEYLCKVRWYLETDYSTAIVDFRDGQFIVSESAEHIYWMEIPEFNQHKQKQ
jgi:hypothetical protein